MYQALWLKLVELDNLQTLSYESNKIIRVHFGITPEIWTSICNQVGIRTYSRTYFVYSVYDLEYKLLGNKPQMWLVLRRYQNGNMEWKLRIGTGHENSNCSEIGWFDCEKEKILETISPILGQTINHLNSLTKLCSLVFSLRTTRLELIKDHLWIDISSWERGFYVVGTLHVHPNGLIQKKGFETLFNSKPICVASKYLACASTFDVAFKKILSEQNDFSLAKDQLKSYRVFKELPFCRLSLNYRQDKEFECFPSHKGDPSIELFSIHMSSYAFSLFSTKHL
jgi:hypothetical protein